MKKVVMVLAMFVSTSAMAASIDALKAVLDNAEVQNLTSINSLKVESVYKCLGCYDVRVDGTRETVAGLPRVDAYLLVRTEGDIFSSTIKTTVVESSK